MQFFSGKCTAWGNAHRQMRAAALLGLFLIVTGMAVCPQLHKLIHQGADEADHSCAVTLLLSGGNEAPLSIAEVGLISAETFTAPNFEPQSAIPFFVSCFVPDHSPPLVS